MADNDQDKTEYQSQKKLEQSRDKGEMPRSQELATFIVFAVFLMYFSMMRVAWLDGFGGIMRDMLNIDRGFNLTVDTVGEFLIGPVVRAAMLLAPLFVVLMFLSPAITMAQTGFNIAKDKLSFDASRMNPISGIQRMFSMRQWVEGGKSTLKIGLFMYLAWLPIHESLPKLAVLGARDLRDQLNVLFDIAIDIGVRVSVMMAILAVVDYGYQWWTFYKTTLMTHQEMKDEMKEREGNPMIKQRQRQIAMQRARQRMAGEVPKASVIVTNPTHFAVALTYDKDRQGAPFVCAKGTQHMAKRIREIAKANGVPIIENRPLARALYKKVKVGQPIPSEFYKAVAEVLAFVFLLKRHGKTVPAHMRPREIELADL
jgi:flagellar biosynthetic protein FlhB